MKMVWAENDRWSDTGITESLTDVGEGRSVCVGGGDNQDCNIERIRPISLRTCSVFEAVINASFLAISSTTASTSVLKTTGKHAQP